jgi:hypothetical protein
MWSVLKHIIETIQKQEGDGKFLIVKLPNKQELQILAVPDEFDREEEEEEEELDDEDLDENESSMTGGHSDDLDM